jgi:outer membrane murein-binding lipoprotein Lpp
MARTVAELEAEIARLQAEFNAVQAAARASGDINSPLLNTRE